MCFDEWHLVSTALAEDIWVMITYSADTCALSVSDLFKLSTSFPSIAYPCRKPKLVHENQQYEKSHRSRTPGHQGLPRLQCRRCRGEHPGNLMVLLVSIALGASGVRRVVGGRGAVLPKRRYQSWEYFIAGDGGTVGAATGLIGWI